MASSAIEGFVTGFAGTLADNILENKQRARDYFDKQVEYARTTGLERRREARAAADAGVMVANQLRAINVPTDVIAQQVQANPDGLSTLYETAEKIRAKREAQLGRPMTEAEWRTIFKVADGYKAPNEDLATLITRSYDPIVEAVSDPTSDQDLEGNLFTRLLGIDPMERARRDLKTTVIADGLTADQLIYQGDGPRRDPSVTAPVIDYSQVGEEEEPDFREIQFFDKEVEDRLDPILTAAVTDGKLQIPSDATAGSPQDATSVVNPLIENLVETYGEKNRALITRLVKTKVEKAGYSFGGETPAEMPTEGENSPVEGPSAPPPSGDSLEQNTLSEGPPTASTDVVVVAPAEELAKWDESKIFKEYDSAIAAAPEGSSERLALQNQRDALSFGLKAGLSVPDMVADNFAVLNRLGAYILEQAVAPVVSAVSPSAGQAVYDYAEGAKTLADQAATKFQVAPSKTDDRAISEEETNLKNITHDFGDGKLTRLTFVKDLGYGLSLYTDGKTQYKLSNAQIRSKFN